MRAAGAGQLAGQRFEHGAKFRIGDLPQALAEFLGNGRIGRALRPRFGPGGAPLAEGDLRDSLIAEEAVYPLDDQRAEVLDQRRMRALDREGQRAAALLAGREADRFGG